MDERAMVTEELAGGVKLTYPKGTKYVLCYESIDGTGRNYEVGNPILIMSIVCSLVAKTISRFTDKEDSDMMFARRAFLQAIMFAFKLADDSITINVTDSDGTELKIDTDDQCE